VELKRYHAIETAIGGDNVQAAGDLILNDPLVAALIHIGMQLEREDQRHRDNYFDLANRVT
jgi:hypothetical protein